MIPGKGWYRPLWNQKKIQDACPSVFASNVLSGGIRNKDWWLAAKRNTAKTYNWGPFAAAPVLERTVPAPSAESTIRTANLVADCDSIFAAAPKAIRYGPGSFQPDSIALAGSTGRVSILDSDGIIREGWPLLANSYRAPPAVGKLTASDANPVLVTAEETHANDSRAMVWEMTPAPVLRWEALVADPVKAPPMIADLNNDGVSEILVLTTDPELIVLTAKGASDPKSPVPLGRRFGTARTCSPRVPPWLWTSTATA